MKTIFSVQCFRMNKFFLFADSKMTEAEAGAVVVVMTATTLSMTEDPQLVAETALAMEVVDLGVRMKPTSLFQLRSAALSLAKVRNG